MSRFMKYTFAAFLFTVLILGSCKQQNETEEVQESPAEEQKAPESVPAIDVNYIQGKFDPETHPEFVEIDTTYADRPGMYLRKDTYQAYRQMYRAAREDGIDLVIRSATRNFEYQKGIWERKWTGETKIENGKDASVAYTDPVDRALAILKYSSMPGTSRHHWGTDIDLNAFENTWFESGDGLKVYEWLTANASTYGFCQPYTAKGESRPHGYEEEKWHWSFKPISARLTLMASRQLEDSGITGFQGSETAEDIGVVEKYVLGVNAACR